MISVIIPTYNRADLLPKTILSVKNQTYKDIEIIVVDDASTDNTPEVVRDLLRDNDTYIRLLTNSGSSSRPRNEGLKFAKGEYISFLDSDDWLEPTCLEKLHQKMNLCDPDVGVVYAGVYEINEDGKIIQKLHERFESGYVLEQQLAHSVCSVTGSLIRAKCFNVCGLFDEGEVLPHTDMWIRLAKEYKFDCIQEYLAYFLRHDNQFSSRNFAKYFINLVGKYREYYDVYPDSLYEVYEIISYQYIKMSNRKNFLKYFMRSKKSYKLIHYINLVLLLIHPRLPALISPLYRSVIRYLPNSLRLER